MSAVPGAIFSIVGLSKQDQHSDFVSLKTAGRRARRRTKTHTGGRCQGVVE